MKNGTEYVLRFGNLTSADGEEQQDEAAPADQASADSSTADKKKDSDVHRYLFVMARFNENAVKQPELQQLPELPKTDAAEPAAPPDAAVRPPHAAARRRGRAEAGNGSSGSRTGRLCCRSRTVERGCRCGASHASGRRRGRDDDGNRFSRRGRR